MPYKVFAAGEEALASDVNTQLMQQVVSRHASASARSAAITAPIKGQLSQLDTDPVALEIYGGSSWLSLGLPVGMRYTHQTGLGLQSPNATITYQMPGFTYPRLAGAVLLQFQCYITLGSGSGAGGWTFRVVTNGVNAPAVAPFSFISQTPNFTGGIVPITALYRSVPANTNIGPSIQIVGTGGGATASIDALSGSMLFFAPNVEF